MSVKKFGKHRSVDPRYYNVPYKYLTSVRGKNVDGKDKWRYETYEEFRAKYKDRWGKDITEEEFKAAIKYYKENRPDWDRDGDIREKIILKEGKDKSLCIVDFFGKKLALVGWRNNKTYSISMPKVYPIIWEGKKGYILYHDQKLLFTDKWGWVI